MGAVFSFLGMLLLSVVVAMLAALQLADHFGTNEEFIVIIVAVAGGAVVAMTAFAVTFATASRARVFQLTAAGLVLPALALGLALGSTDWIANLSSNRHAVGEQQIPITLELIIPALLIVLVQWGLVRRRWLREHGEDDLTLWPWITTVVAGLVVLNPIGLELIATTIRHSPTDWFWELGLWITTGGALILIVAAMVECYIRTRMLRRRRGEPI